LSTHVSIFTQLSAVINAADLEIHLAVLGKPITFIVSAMQFGILTSLKGFF